MIEPILLWWFTAQCIGLVVLPLVQRIFLSLPGGAFAFSKTAGLLVIGYLVWFGAITGLWSSSLDGIVLSLLLAGTASLILITSQGFKPWHAQLRETWRSHRAHIITGEVLFLACFCAWAVVRAYAPDKILPSGGEKFMEIAFLNGVLNSPQFPPIDPWLSGYAISYYYFGYVMMAIMTRITAVLPTVGFELYDALLFALSAQCAYGLISLLVAVSGGTLRAARSTGLLGAAMVVLMGNLQGLVEGLYSVRALPQAFFEWLSIPGLVGSSSSGSFYPGHGWWWWRASRVLEDVDLSYNPVAVQPIDEFPFFSFLLGDNHPHKLALPFGLLCIGLCLAFFLSHRGSRRGIDLWVAGALALAIGGLGFLNTWDMPVMLALAALVFLLRQPDITDSWQKIVTTVLFFAALALSAVALYLYFYLGFSSQAGGILPYIFPPTRLVQFLIMFGPFVWALTIFLPFSLQRRMGGFPWRRAARMWLVLAGVATGVYILVLLAGAALVRRLDGAALAALQETYLAGESITRLPLRVLIDRIQNPWLLLLGSALITLAVLILFTPAPPPSASEPVSTTRTAPDPLRFAVLLALLGLALVLAVEFFYLRDNFGARMNTVFKFYYQGWVLLACASAYATWWVAAHARLPGRLVFGLVSVVILAAGFVYPMMAIWSRVEGFQRQPTLDASASVAGFYPGHWAAQPDDWAAIVWLNEQVRPGGKNPVILEAPGGAYEHNNRVSAFTGLPGLLGWQNHEAQWRGTTTEQDRRRAEIDQIYTSPDEQTTLALLRAWNVGYVVFGSAESEYILRLCAEPHNACAPERVQAKFERILDPVFSQGSTTIYSVP